MSDTAATDRAGFPTRNGVPAALSSESIERILTDFRVWLETHGTEPAVEPATEPIDFEILVAQFTALRHEVNLQTRASRALSEQASRLLDVAGGDEPQPVVKAILDIADVLAAASKQMSKLREIAEPLLESLAMEPLPDRPAVGFLARSFGTAWSGWASAVELQDEGRREAAANAAATMLELTTAAADGYAMSLRRVERAFPDLGLEPIECLGLPYDPETMEVVEVGGDGPAGTVTEVLRRGYRCNRRVVRYAQVRVAR